MSGKIVTPHLRRGAEAPFGSVLPLKGKDAARESLITFAGFPSTVGLRLAGRYGQSEAERSLPLHKGAMKGASNNQIKVQERKQQ